MRRLALTDIVGSVGGITTTFGRRRGRCANTYFETKNGMTRSAGHFKAFQPHTKHKHLILREYFLAWGHKLGLRAGAGDAILYVDACAGRGADDLGNQGSPVIAAVAAEMAQDNISRRRSRAFRIHVVAIESMSSHVKTLEALLQPFGPEVRVLKGTLADHLTDISENYLGIPALFFIDPFGLEALDASVVREALSGARREAMLLFADQAALRHFGAINAQETRAEKRHRIAAAPLPLFPDLKADNVAELAQAALESRTQLETTREHAARILNAAFGDDDWLGMIEAVPRFERRAVFLELYSARLRSWGAEYVLPIPVVDGSGVHAYTLIHASKSAKAYATMKLAVTHALDHSPLPKTVVARMRDLIGSDLASVEAMVRSRFSGQTVRWAQDTGNPKAACVRNYALEETPALPFELDVLKTQLKSFRLNGKAIVYAFPETRADVNQD